MRRLGLVFTCFCLVGCEPAEVRNPTTFKERQKQLFYEIDHQLVYQGCQELMRLHREGKLSRTTFYCDDTISGYELPEPISALRPTYVRVDEMMVNINFHSKDGLQLLRCFSSEFGESKARNDEPKGLGFRNDPFDMDELSGTESLEYLNENYNHFQMELIPGLIYERYTEEEAKTLEEIKRDNESMDKLMDFMMESIHELAVKKQKLLHQTDHHELLRACRQVIERYNDGAYSRAKINIRDASTEDLKQIPRIILDLDPVSVWLEEKRVIVALIGGMDHAGVMAYMNNEEAVPRDDDMKLIEGLRYYDDGLREADDDYREYLDSLRDEAITYLDWKRKKMGLPIPGRKRIP